MKIFFQVFGAIAVAISCYTLGFAHGNSGGRTFADIDLHSFFDGVFHLGQASAYFVEKNFSDGTKQYQRAMNGIKDSGAFVNLEKADRVEKYLLNNKDIGANQTIQVYNNLIGQLVPKN